MENTSNEIPSVDPARESAIRYDEFLGPMFFEPYAIEIASRIDPSMVSLALEIAAGTGRVTSHIRKRISASAGLIASDISEDMLAVAKEKLSNLNIDWQIIDAQHLPFSNNSIDLIVCSFGYMFVPDRQQAFAEAYRVLKRGGMLLFTTWDKLENNAASYISRTVAKRYMEDAFAESYSMATSMHEESVIRPLLEDAGFSKVSIEKVEKRSVCSSAKAAAVGLVQNGQVFQEIRKQHPACIGEMIISIERELSEKYGAAPMIAPISAVVSQAWK